MSNGLRNYYTLEIARHKSISEPASDLPNQVLTKLSELGTPMQDEVVAGFEDETRVKNLLDTMINLRLVTSSGGRLQLSDSGKEAVRARFYSISD